jgi:D-glycero-D-manno-heptose 1,7-bisphosphate phosphatase
VRILVHSDSGLERRGRMAMAAAGLALRGHEVLWAGGAPPDFPGGRPTTLRTTEVTGLGLARHAAEVVLGGGAPRRAAVAGWLARARCMVLGLEAAALARWNPVDRALWDSLHSWGLLEEAEGPALQAAPRGLDLERVALWPPGRAPAAPDAAHPDVETLERVCERALARQRGRAPRPAVFVDRDGTLVVERGYLSDPAGLEFLPGTAEALHDLKAAGMAVIVVSNQSGVGRGLFPLARVHEAMARLRVDLRAAGVELDGVYFCPHRPEDGCACRKPGTLLLERAAEDHLLSLRGSFMVGDKRIDAETGRRAGARGILVRSGYGREEEGALDDPDTGWPPDAVCDDLPAAAAWILATREAADQG